MMTRKISSSLDECGTAAENLPPSPRRAVCMAVLVVAAVIPMRTAAGGRLLVKSEPRGARVYLDDDEEPRAKTPCLLMDVSVGTHIILGRLDGYADVTQKVEVYEDATGRATLTFGDRQSAESDADGPDPDDDPGPWAETPPEVPDEPAGRSETGPARAKDAGADEDRPPKYVQIDCPVCRATGLLQEMGCPKCMGLTYDGPNRCTECGRTGRIEHECASCEGKGVVVQGGREGTCAACRGKGKLPCLLCRGSGKLKRPNPQASNKPTSKCPHCEGSGFDERTKCVRCSGNGETFVGGGGRRRRRRQIDCPFCKGDGAGAPICRRCRGAGVVNPDKNPSPCQACFGTGHEFHPCRSCGGRGWVYSK